jgi:hypothetical protein
MVPSGRRSFYQADRAEVDRAMREGRQISTDHMSEKIRHPGNHF